MTEDIDVFEVPYLEEMLQYLPIDPIDREDVNMYIQNIVQLIGVNYKYEQYQFAYFGFHLLYMSYIYCTVWKIGRINRERYQDAVLFARPYEGKSLDLFNIQSIFEYSYIPEKELPKIFKMIELDDAQVGKICSLVNIRNEMAHASGKLGIPTDEEFASNVSSILSSVKNIHLCMNKQIRKWFSDVLINYAQGKFDDDYSDANDIIESEMIQNGNLSRNELLICNEMSIRELCGGRQPDAPKFQQFKASLKSYCTSKEYITAV